MRATGAGVDTAAGGGASSAGAGTGGGAGNAGTGRVDMPSEGVLMGTVIVSLVNLMFLSTLTEFFSAQ